MKKKKTNIYWRVFIISMIILLSYKLTVGSNNIFIHVKGLIEVLKPFLFAILVAYILYIPSKKLESFFKRSEYKIINKKARTISIFIVYVTAFIILYFAFKWFLPFIISSATDLIQNIPGYIERAEKYFLTNPVRIFGSELDIAGEIRKIKETNFLTIILKTENAGSIVQQLNKAFTVASSIFNIFVTVIVSIYMLYYRTDIARFISKVVEAFGTKKLAKNTGRYMAKTNYIFFKFVTTQILDGIIVGILISIALIICKIKYAIPLGFLIGLFNLIPFFGAIFAVGVATIITIFTGGVNSALLMLIVTSILQQIDANILNPILLGQSLEINKILIIASVTIGGAYFGPLGMFLAVPVVTVLKIMVDEYVEMKLTEKKIEAITTKKKKIKLVRKKDDLKKTYVR